jgi:mono/diheme cytochrome c family protein
MRSAVVIFVVAAVVMSCNRAASTKPADTPPANSPVTPVDGPSWLNHLGIAMTATPMGQMGGTAPALDTSRREPEIEPQEGAQALKQKFELSGADLYRIDCRSCHGPDGKGAPPAIASLIGPVQGTSKSLIQQRMEQRGAPISEEMAAQMATQAEQAIRDRLRKGGQKMPAFPDLRPEEIAALLGYLRQMASVPGKTGTATVTEPAAHVGEEVIKGTCHICHAATGPGGSRMAIMMQGIIPSLASLPEYQSLSEVTRQVHYGTRMMMMMRSNRMPPFPYFTEQEIAAAYLYLEAYPPGK